MIIHSFELFLILLVLSVGVTAIAKKVDKPYPIALVLIGAFIGLAPVAGVFDELKDFFASDEVFRAVIITIFLPALLGEASLKLSFNAVSKNRAPIILLAFAGTFIAYLTTGGLAYEFLNLPLQTALVFGAVMAATDPISVLSIFKTLGVNRRLAVIMEGESLVNDGISVVLFKLSAYSLASITAMGVWGVAAGFAAFFKVVVGGLLVGGILGFMISQIGRLFDDYPLENAFSFILFYGSYLFAEYLGVSGVIAVVTAGLVLGNYGKVIGMSPTTRLSISVFWDTITLVTNSLVFILVGLEIARINMADHLTQILAGIAVVVIGRSAAVYLPTVGVRLPWSWKHVLNWGGLKGSLSLALALSLPPAFAGRETLIALTFGVVFFSLVAQGLTIAPFIRLFGLQKTLSGLKEYENLSFALQQALAANEELNRLHLQGRVSPPVFSHLEQENSERIVSIHRKLDELYHQHPELLQEQKLAARKKLLYAEHQAIEKLLAEGVLSLETGNERKRLVLEHLEALEKGELPNNVVEENGENDQNGKP
ncbi:MAG: cation:proton antiporter [Bacillota bacterium]